ncbi:hypothetical protein P9250_25855 [Caballeronia sp. LP006]|jgi:hypothetical protein|uniref:hypothetical protein n=1 Tax=unclassified Caballeronia TaxID=2646786 RepID=UPI001FD0DF85|nr:MULTISPECIES: hypothetical protein [unclassified Caballeronia]MDR5771354.1 hypothetical protein [Caballeronia sp. LZ002]MDR5805116.1 hypothetical protein [Caballeronia sp. LZ001]MDR5831303.1 hypothetical protein [Caballeronia sp. LP006]MDR5846790.1 hypothetical protein [Caballeronia sp. LZ003]
MSHPPEEDHGSTREARFRRYDAAGEASVRADLDEAATSDPEAASKRAWLHGKEVAHQDEQFRAMFASVNSANDAAQLARESAQASRRSAFWTMIAAIAATAGVIVNAAIALGWLDWLKR